ncbi:MAG: YqaJ viral recombinase family protein [Holosporales bacterium]|jgi:hypothetical protein|nr:YqaJ viral recombinase family protein [Holosporales bacterium]
MTKKNTFQFSNCAIDDPELFANKKEDFLEKVNSFVDKSLLNSAEEPREYLGASLLGNKCARCIQFTFLGATPDKPDTGQQKRIFEMGHVLENVMAQWLRNAGFELETRDESGQQFGFTQADGRIQGHVDGIIRSGPLDLKYPILWECKTMKSAVWRDLVKDKLEIANSQYFAQIQLYMAYMKLPQCLFASLNKDTAELYHELILLNTATAAQYSDRAVQILKATESNEFLPRIATKSDWYECKMCRFYNTCWGD